MKNTFIMIGLIFHSIIILGQEKESLYFLETDSTWGKEIFNFPLSFAPEIKYEGIEDARFPKGWGKEDSPNFWSYVFAWNINSNEALTENELENNIQFYFDGLMGINFKGNNEEKIQNPNAIFIKKETSNGNPQ